MATKSIRQKTAALKKRAARLKLEMGKTRIALGKLEGKVSAKQGRAKKISNKKAMEFGRKSAKSVIAGTKDVAQAKKTLTGLAQKNRNKRKKKK